MEKYVTVVSVDDHLQTPATQTPTTQTQTVSSNGGASSAAAAGPLNGNLESGKRTIQEPIRMDHRPLEDSQFVTVLSINPGADGGADSGTEEPNAPEVVLVYRLPGERLGFGLKFQGGTRSNEKIQRLFIQSCAENSPASRVLASWGHLREGDEILEIDGVSVTRMTRIECVKCLKDSNVAIKLLVRNGEGKVQNFFPEGGAGSSGGLENVGGELPERKSAPPPPPPVPPRKLNKRKAVTTGTTEQTTPNGGQKEEKQSSGATGTELATSGPPPPPPDAESYSNLFADDISDLISESDDTASTISTVVDKFSICSSLSSEDYTIPSNGAGPMGMGPSLELAKALKPFTLLEQEFNLESKFEPTNLFTFKPPVPQVPASSVATKTSTPASNNVLQLEVAGGTGGEYENVTIMKVDENRNYENVAIPSYGPYENVTIQTVQPYENMVLNRGATNRPRRLSGAEKDAEPEQTSSGGGGVYEQMDLKAQVPPRPLPRQGSTGSAIVEPKKRAPIPVPIPIVVPPPRQKPTVPSMDGAVASVAPLGPEYNTIQSWLQEATEVIHECALVPTDAPTTVSVSEDKIKPSADVGSATDLLPRLIDFHPKVSIPLKALEGDAMDIVAPPTSPKVARRFDGVEQTGAPEPEMIVRKCIKIISSEDHTYIESSSSDEDDDEKLYGRRSRSEDEDDRSSVLSREATTPEQFLSGDGFSDEDGEKLGPPEIVSGGPSEAYFNFPWTSNLLPPIGEVEEEFSSLEHQHNGPIVIIDTADETVINDTNNNQQRERKKPIGDGDALSALVTTRRPHLTNGSASAKIVTGAAPAGTAADVTIMTLTLADRVQGSDQQPPTLEATGDQTFQEQQPVEEEKKEVASPADESDVISALHATDKASEICVTDGSPSGPGLTTCQPTVESEDTADRGTAVMAQHPVDPVVEQLREEQLEASKTATNEPTSGDEERDEGPRKATQAPEPTSEPVDNHQEPNDALEEEVKVVATRKHSVDIREQEERSQIEAICGDVDIVVGDTVESDFEELVRAQIEPLDDVDVADSTEQIQQIHERIIVGIERAVSDDGDHVDVDHDDVDADVVGGDSEASGANAVASASVEETKVAMDAADDSDERPNSTVEQEVAPEIASSVSSVAVADQNSEVHEAAAAAATEEDPSEQEPGHIAALITSGSTAAVAGARDTRNERSVTVIASHPPDGGSDDNSNRNNNNNNSSDDDGVADEVEGNGHGGVPVANSAKSMDSMNNVVTTTTTVTAIASTVHQLIPAPAPATATASPAVASIGGKVAAAAAPPAFSRLPPDGHEFPPNFSEPSSATSTTPTGNGQAAVAAMTIMNPGSLPAPVLSAKSNDKHSSFNDDLPDLPKSHPPPIPRKVLRQDLHTPPKTTNGGPEPATNGDGIRKPPPFPARSSSIAESMLSRKELPPAYQTQSSYEPAAYRRRSVDVPEHPPTKPPTGTGRVTLLGSNWRKDEKSERSVRDKIAMFSSESSSGPVPAPSTMTRKFGSKDFTKSSENLLSRDGGGQSTKRSTVDPIEAYATLRKKAHSVENLDEVDKALPAPRMLASESTPKFSLETSKPVVLGKAYSVENLNPHLRATEVAKSGGGGGLGPDANKVLARTISFSGSYANGSSLASVNQSSSPAAAGDERWKSSISNLLEQRKKSMSKLRGLIIPEKVPEAEVLADSRIIGLPIIKSKDSEIILSGGLPKVDSPALPATSQPALSYSRRTSTLPTPAKSSLNALAQTKTTEAILAPTPYKPRSSHSLVAPGESKQSGSESESGSGFFRKPLPPMPPAKPPRTSLVYPPPKGGSIDSGLRSTEDESGDDDEDSDSVLSSRISSPPVSPAAPVEKYTLTRTLSSETNTSITSSNSSTLTTSSAGSQASCSSVGSTPPTVDLSRKLSKSSTSSEATMNRKNVLASAKCRSGRGGELIKIGAGVDGEQSKSKGPRYEDGDSTDGYEEEERRKVSKSKPRNSTTANVGAAETTDLLKRKELTHYKLVDGNSAAGDSIVDKVIKVAAYVEVVSDLEDASSELLEEEIVTPIKESPVPVLATPTPEAKKTRSASGGGDTMSDLAKWVRHEAARTISSHKDTEPKHQNAGVGRLLVEGRKVVPPRPEPVSTPAPVPVKRELRSSVETKKLNLAEIRKSFESKSANSTVIPAPVKMAAVVMKEPSVNAVVPVPVVPSTPTGIATVAQSSPKSHAVTTTTTTTTGGPANGHDRFSSWDSLASSSSGVSSLQTNSLGLGATAPNCSGSSQTLQSTPSDYGSFSSLGSSHSLITPQDLQLIIEEADPPLATPDAFVVVLQRETPESSIGITLAGGSDYEAKEITIHKILTNSPAEKDGRLRKGDRILSINGLSMRGLTHRESLSVLKTPRPEVVMVITRSKSLVVTDTLAKLKRPSMGSLSSLAEKSELGSDYERKIKAQHKASRSLDLDHLDVASNEAESVFDGTASEDGLLSADDVSKCSSSTNATDNVVPVVADIVDGCRIVDVSKDGAGLGFSIEGGYDSPAGNKPLVIKKIFMGGAAEKSGLLRAGEEIVAINEVSIAKMTRIQVWNMMKKLPNGTVRLTLK